jgi:hypothetical protein
MRPLAGDFCDLICFRPVLMMPSRRFQPPRSRPLLKGQRPEASRTVPGVAAEALLEATISVPWERSVHAARLAFLRRVARPGEVSVHVACGIDRLGFIDAAYGLTTIVTDIDAASLEVLAQQFTELEGRLGPFAGSLQFRQLAVEALAADEGFPQASVHHLTLQNLFNAHLHPAVAYPRIIDALLSVVAPGGSYFLTESEAAVLMRRAQGRRVRLATLGEIQGYYDENVVMLRVRGPAE